MKATKGYFLLSRTFLMNLAILAVVIISGFFIITAVLNNFTHHGQMIELPDFTGKKIDKLYTIKDENNFIFKVVDSLYDSDKAPGTVLDQEPAPKSKVKQNRTIYLTINSINPPDVKMPDLIDVSYRQAESILMSYGLITGEVTYRSDLAKNAVLEQRYKNSIIKPGKMIPKGSVIDLVLGDGFGETEIIIPDLNGLTKSEAWSILKRANLNVGMVLYDKGVDDTLNAKIYRQNPSPDDADILKAGDSVDLFLR